MANNYKVTVVFESVAADNAQEAVNLVVQNVIYGSFEAKTPDHILLSVQDQTWRIFTQDNETGERGEAVIVEDGE